jgi:DMSO/TMAO reductase YedYZ molybdopterin-dependent catalytic subunit
MMPVEPRRRFLVRLLAAGGAALLAGCDRLSHSDWFPRLLQNGEALSRRAQHLVTPRKSMAQEFSETDLSPSFRSNGTDYPSDPGYRVLAAGNFAAYRLKVFGLVERPRSFSLEELRALPSRTQITRHDCVEGWSAIGKWKGARLGPLLDSVGLHPQARYAVFHCADTMDASGARYYESIDMEDAHHPQTLLAYELNDRPLPIANGAPVRLRVERQLGYKMAKYVMAIELTDSLARIRGGKGGYWEDLGYEWYAGI